MFRGAKNNMATGLDEKYFDQNSLKLKDDERRFVVKFLSQVNQLKFYNN